LRKGIIVGIILLLGVLGVAGSRMLRMTPEVQQEYTSLFSLSTQSTPEPTYSSHQQRKNVNKNLYLTDKDKRLHVRIRSDASYVDFETDGHETQVVEHLKNFVTLMQEDVYDVNNKAMQVLREVIAKEGVYYYKHNRFLADDVNIARYIVPGHTLPNKLKKTQPLMTGHAESAELNLDNSFKFTAQNMRATIHSIDNE
jgi:hypothetical protein